MEIDRANYLIRPGFVYWKDGAEYRFEDKISLECGYLTPIGFHALKIIEKYFSPAQLAQELYSALPNTIPNLEQIQDDLVPFIKELEKRGVLLKGRLRDLARKYWLAGKNTDRLGYSRPSLIYWEVTKKCNLKCRFCYNSPNYPSAAELNIQQGLDLIDKFHSEGVTNIIFTGGEPLLEGKKLFTWIRHCSDLNISSELFTNGSLLDPNTAIRLKNSDLKYCRISNHGHNDQLHDWVTQTQGSWLKAQQAITNLINVSIPATWMITVGKFNYNHLRNCLERAIEIGCHGFMTGPLCLIGKGVSMEEMVLDPSQYLGLQRFIKESMLIYGDRIRLSWGADINMDGPWKDMVLEPIVSVPEGRELFDYFMRFAKNSICGTGVRSIGLSADGWYIPCPATGSIRLAPAIDNDIESIWSLKPLIDLREKTLQDFDDCGECEVRYACAGGCRANAFSRTGSLTGCDVNYREAFAWLAKKGSQEIKSFYSDDKLANTVVKPRQDVRVLGPNTEGHGPWVPHTATALFAKLHATHGY